MGVRDHSASVTTVDLLRHGEPIGGKRYRGQIDDPLSEKGWLQMRAAVGNLAPWQAIVSSPLQRCSEFAHELAGRHNLPLEQDERLIEVGFGSWEGRTTQELLATEPEAFRDFYRDPIAFAPTGAEPLERFRARIVSAWEDLLQRHENRHVLLVGHAGTIRVVLSWALGIPLKVVFRIHVPYAGLTRIDLKGRGGEAVPRLVFHGLASLPATQGASSII